MRTYFGGPDDNNDYLQWVTETSSTYAASLYVPSTSNPADGAAVHWNIVDDYIYLGVAVKATGWVGFGIAEAGGMLGADMFIFQTDVPDKVTDAHVKDSRYPIVDDCEDWEFINAKYGDSSDFLIVEVRRLLDTDDDQDRRILPDSSPIVPAHRIIAAWGDSGSFQYHDSRRSRGAVRWYLFGLDESAFFAQKMEQEADGYFELRASDYQIKPLDTEYVENCIMWNQIVAQLPSNVDFATFTVIGYMPVIEEASSPFIHHFSLFGGPREELGECHERGIMQDLVYVWAPGEGPRLLPDDVGIPFGVDGHRSLRLQVHYNNPRLIEDAPLDRSGIRVYYSFQPREHELGSFVVGFSPFLVGDSVGNGIAQHTFDCPSSCSQLYLEEPVTIIGEGLHMHKAGMQMSSEFIRDGKVVHKGKVDYFDFDQQGSFQVQQDEPLQVMPGDAIRLQCTYNSNEDTKFGYSSQEEMCSVFYFYYPRVRGRVPWACVPMPRLPLLRRCRTEHNSKLLHSMDEIERQFGSSNGICGKDEELDDGDSDIEYEDGTCPEENECFSLLGSRFRMHEIDQDDGTCRSRCIGALQIELRQSEGWSCGGCP